MANLFFMGLLNTLAAAAVIWLCGAAIRLYKSTARFMREYPERATQSIESSTKVKSRAAAYAYADHLFGDAKFLALLAFLLGIFLAAASSSQVDTEAALFLVPIRVILTIGSCIFGLFGTFFGYLAMNLSAKLEAYKRSDLDK
jgi:hypothetical protein